MRHFIKKRSLYFLLILIFAACNNHKSPRNNIKISFIDSTKTRFIEYAYDEQYYLETIYFDSAGILLKTVKYDDLARSVIYNVSSKKADTLKIMEGYK